jgi:hypothetical protein
MREGILNDATKKAADATSSIATSSGHAHSSTLASSLERYPSSSIVSRSNASSSIKIDHVLSQGQRECWAHSPTKLPAVAEESQQNPQVEDANETEIESNIRTMSAIRSGESSV